MEWLPIHVSEWKKYIGALLSLVICVILPGAQVFSSPFTVDVTGESSGFPGTLLEFQPAAGSVKLENLRVGAPVFIIQTQEGEQRVPVDGFSVMASNGDTLITETRGSESFGLGSLIIRQTWIMRDQELDFKLTLIAGDTVDVRNDLHVRLGLENADVHTFLNANGFVDTARANSSRTISTSMQNGIIAHRNGERLVMIMDNPLYGDIYWDRTNGLEWCILRTRISETTAQEKTLVHSVLVPGQVIERQLRLYATDKTYSIGADVGMWVSPSAQQGSATNSILLIGDDIPFELGHGPWPDSTDSSNPFGSLMVRFLKENPSVVLSCALCLDGSGLWLSMDKYSTGGWTMPPGCLAYTTYDRFSGERSLRSEVLSGDTAQIYQKVTILETNPITVKGMVYIPTPFADGSGMKFAVETLDGTASWTSPWLSTTDGWQLMSYTTPVLLPAGTQVNIHIFVYKKPFDVEPSDPVEHQDTRSAFLDDVEVLNGESLLAVNNPGFEQGKTLYYFDSPDYGFWDSHSYRRYADFEESKLEWFRRIDQKQYLYDWERRVNLIVHTYHHATNREYIRRPGHGIEYGQEWTHNVPAWHIASLDAIDEDLGKMGLSRIKMAVRPAGIEYHHFTVQELLRRGYRWMDQSFSHNDYFTFFPIYGDSSYIWMHGLMFWGDELGTGWGRLWMTQQVMMFGGTSLWGFHPASALGYWDQDATKLDKFSGYINDIESLFPGMIWEIPNDIVERGDILDQWKNTGQILSSKVVVYFWSGFVRHNVSLLVFHPTAEAPVLSATLDDGRSLNVVNRGKRSHVLLPELGDGSHQVTIRLIDQKLPSVLLPWSPYLKIWPVPSNSAVRVAWFDYGLSGEATVSLYDLLGRQVVRETRPVRNSSLWMSISTDGLPSGVYFLRLGCTGNPNLTKARKVVLIK